VYLQVPALMRHSIHHPALAPVSSGYSLQWWSAERSMLVKIPVLSRAEPLHRSFPQDFGQLNPTPWYKPSMLSSERLRRIELLVERQLSIASSQRLQLSCGILPELSVGAE
jgi:hypothetical protein